MPSAPTSTTKLRHHHLLVDPAALAAVAAEEERRREQSVRRTLFVGGLYVESTPYSTLKALHPEIVGVRVAGSNAWIVFTTALAARSAVPVLERKTPKGTVINRATSSKSDRTCRLQSGNDRPINPLALVVWGLSDTTSKRQVEEAFPDAVDVYFPHRRLDQE